jgi:ech hydrogenase subunit A
MLFYSFLVLLPVIMAIAVMKISYQRIPLVMFLFSIVLASISIMLFSSSPAFSFSLDPFSHIVLVVVDVALLVYFLKEGLKFSAPLVWGLAVVQLVLFGIAKLYLGGTGADFVIDSLAGFMVTVINVVGAFIVVFAVWYIDKESVNEQRKRTFLMVLTLFLAVMNLIVIANSLMIFFLLFELTTLASYLLIGFRKDTISQGNALKALWMNQIGGVLILSAVIVGNAQGIAPYFTALMGSEGFLVLVALIAMAALIKGAQMPFDGWLLGAMVAPTPVSAILHSATMVKLAPFVVLKLSPAMAGTLVADVLIAFGACVFVVGGAYGLAREKFKEILGYSTISLLGLMVAMAAMVGEGDPSVVYALIFFHAVSKALLFLLAGILEKNHHVKEIWQMDGLMYKAPLSTMMVMLGFGTITLPPFGLFFGKLFSIELVAANLSNSAAYLILLVALALGSALLVLLYFKVASLLFSKRADTETYTKERLWSSEMIAPVVFSVILAFSATLLISNGLAVSMPYVWLSLAMIVLVPLWIRLSPFKGVDRVSEYHCGEQAHFGVAQWSFDVSKSTQTKIALLGTLAFVLILLGGVA